MVNGETSLKLLSSHQPQFFTIGYKQKNRGHRCFCLTCKTYQKKGTRFRWLTGKCILAIKKNPRSNATSCQHTDRKKLYRDGWLC